jgi:hypothetical protein
MVEVQVDTGGPDRVDPMPHHLGDLLGHALIVPASGTAEIPFRMIAEKTGHVNLLAAAPVPMIKADFPLRQNPAGECHRIFFLWR